MLLLLFGALIVYWQVASTPASTARELNMTCNEAEVDQVRQQSSAPAEEPASPEAMSVADDSAEEFSYKGAVCPLRSEEVSAAAGAQKTTWFYMCGSSVVC